MNSASFRSGNNVFNSYKTAIRWIKFYEQLTHIEVGLDQVERRRADARDEIGALLRDELNNKLWLINNFSNFAEIRGFCTDNNKRLFLEEFMNKLGA